MNLVLRRATSDDVPVLETLIAESARGLGQRDYSPAQIEAAIGTAWAVDRHLIQDGSLWIAEVSGEIVGCGGWSRRRAVAGASTTASETDLLSPGNDAARIRGFFVHPRWARRGIGTELLKTCEGEARAAGFHSLELLATLPGERLYASRGYTSGEPYEFPLGHGQSNTVIPMRKLLPDPRAAHDDVAAAELVGRPSGSVRRTVEVAMGERFTNLSLQPLRAGEESLASDLVMRSYRAATTTNDSAEGVEEFTRYASAARISSRISEGSIVVMASLGAVAIGVVEVRTPAHIGLLFICPDHQGRGVGRSLCKTAFEAAERMLPRPTKVTVNSAPGAVAFYEKLGFVVAGAMTELKGIRFVPMEREVGV